MIGEVQQDMDDVDMPDTNVGSGNVPSSVSSATGSVPSTPSVPSSGSTSGDHHPSVAQHDNVFNIENGN